MDEAPERLYHEAGFGWVLYTRGEPLPDDPTKVTYNHAGLVRTEEEAQRWVDGGEPDRVVYVYGKPRK